MSKITKENAEKIYKEIIIFIQGYETRTDMYDVATIRIIDLIMAGRLNFDAKNPGKKGITITLIDPVKNSLGEEINSITIKRMSNGKQRDLGLSLKLLQDANGAFDNMDKFIQGYTGENETFTDAIDPIDASSLWAVIQLFLQ